MAERNVLETNQTSATVDSTLPQPSSGSCIAVWISSKNETGVRDHLSSHGIGVDDISLIVTLRGDVYEALVKKDRMYELLEIAGVYAAFDEKSPLRQKGAQALRITYNAYKTKKREGLQPEQYEPWNSRMKELKARLPELRSSLGFPFVFPHVT